MHVLRKIASAVAAILMTGMMAIIPATPAMAEENPVPSKPQWYVQDEAGLLSNEQEEQLNSLLRDYDESTHNQIAVLLVRTTNGEPIEHYSYRVASAWGLGTKGGNNGVLITVAALDHKDRIEVGKGLEDTLTDSRSGRILRSSEVTQAFRNDRWYDGIHSIITQTQECIKTKGASVENTEDAPPIAITILFIILIWALNFTFIHMFIRFFESRIATVILSGIDIAGVASIIYTFINMSFLFKSLIFSLVVFFLLFVPLMFFFSDDGGYSGGSGGSYGGGSGGYSSGGFSGGSSFGGGSFGGGGASGSW